ncbi:MAG: ABC transporter permease, partial [Pseudoflavonifractor sp.]
MKQKITKVSFQILAVLVVAILLILAAGANPIRAIQIFFYGIFGSANGFMEIFVKAAPLIFLGLGVSVSFKTGFFNIGAEGQLYMGALAAAGVVFACSGLPGWLRIVLSIV